jgi:hypothetical protein
MNVEHDAECSTSVSPMSESIAAGENLRYFNAGS